MSLVIGLDHDGCALDQNLYLYVPMMDENMFLKYLISGDGEIEGLVGINEYLIFMPRDSFVRSSVLIGDFLIGSKCHKDAFRHKANVESSEFYEGKDVVCLGNVI